MIFANLSGGRDSTAMVVRFLELVVHHNKVKPL